jgi:ribose transport system permease protein
MRWDVPVIGLLPAALLVLLAVGAALWWLMHRTNYGRLLHAVGDNPEAACLAGVPVARVRVLAFVISSASAVVAGVLLGGFSGVSLDVGNGYELQAITAAVLGSTQLLGGRGSVGPTVGTALTLKAIFTLLNLLGLPQPVREVVQGLILLLAVAAPVRRRATG